MSNGRAALAVLNVIENHSILSHVQYMHDKIKHAFELALADLAGIKIRSKGMMFGIELPIVCTELMTIALQNKVLINVTSGNVIRLLPPLVMTAEEANQMVDMVSRLIIDFIAKNPVESVA